MRGRDWIAGLLAAPEVPAPTWRDVLDYARQEHGRGATRWLADTLSVTQRTAQRYFTGQHSPTRHQVREHLGPLVESLRAEAQAEADQLHREETAAYLAEIQALRPRGPLLVRSKSDLKELPTIRKVVDYYRVDLTEAAEAWRAGDDERAEELLSDQIIGGYGGSGTGLAEILEVDDYLGGLDYL
jgi:hypothetical protein